MRFVLIVLALMDNGSMAPIEFQNNTFSTETACERAGERLVQAAKSAGATARIIFACLDRGSAT
jgi:hypothetical protein